MLRSFADLLAFRRDPLAFFLERGSAAEQPLVELRLGLHPMYLVTDPGLVKQILRAEESEIDKGRLIYKMREVIGRSSLTISGEEHRERRAAIHRQMVEGLNGGYVAQINATLRQAIVALSRESGAVEAHQLTAGLALRVVCAILFGRGALSSGDEAALVEAVHLVEDDVAEEMFRALPHTPWAYWRKKRKLRYGRDIMMSVVERARRNATETSLLRAFETLGLEGDALRDEVLLMLLAGHHTTGTAAAWILYHLGIDPGLSARLSEEARLLSREAGEVTAQSLKSATVSRAFVQEVLRLYPSTYWMSRETRAPVTLAGRNLKPGTSLLMSPWHLHRDPRFWSEPERFRLDRPFAGHQAYMPFGFGPRACVGMMVAMAELQLMALEFAAAFDITVTSQVPAAPPKPSVTLVPSDIRLLLRPKLAAHTAHRAA